MQRSERRVQAFVSEEELRDMPGHDRQVSVRCTHLAGIAVDPLDAIAIRAVATNVEHRRRWIDPDHLVAAPSELSSDQPGTATEIDNDARADIGRELRVEVWLRAGAIGVDRFVDRDQSRVTELGDA